MTSGTVVLPSYGLPVQQVIEAEGATAAIAAGELGPTTECSSIPVISMV